MDRVFDEAVPSQAANESVVAAVLEGVEEAGSGEESKEENFLPAKLLNNAAALHLRGGDKEAAIQLMYEAIEVAPTAAFPFCSSFANTATEKQASLYNQTWNCLLVGEEGLHAGKSTDLKETYMVSSQAANAPGGSGLAASNQLTLGYNLARAKEANGDLTQAAKEYQDILAEFPEYLDCYFRLAWIARSRGNHPEALRWAEKALEVKEKDSNALALIGAFSGRTDLA